LGHYRKYPAYSAEDTSVIRGLWCNDKHAGIEKDKRHDEAAYE